MGESQLKKLATIFAGTILALPIFAAIPVSTANAAKTKTYHFSILTSDFYDKGRVYHTKDHAVTVYRAAIGADTPSIDFTARGKLKAATTYYVTQYVKAKSNATKKNRAFLYVKNHGWVQSTKLVKGAFQQAD